MGRSWNGFPAEGILVSAARFSSVDTHLEAQPLPATQDFSGLAWTSTTYPPGWQGWRLTTAPGASFNTAAPSADASLRASGDASRTSTGPWNYNGKIGYLSGTNDFGLVF